MSESSSPPNPSPPASGHRAVATSSQHLDTRTAATEVAAALADGLDASCDLLVVHASFHHAAALEEAVEILRRTLSPTVSLAVTAESVVSTAIELEGLPGLAASAMHLPGCRLTPWFGTPDDPVPISRPEEVPARIGLEADTRLVILLGEPFTTPVSRLIPALDRAAAGIPIVGGMASGASRPGHNVLILDDRTIRRGLIGVTISGNLEAGTLVSQGARPIGEPLVITSVDDEHFVTGLGGRPVMEMLEHEMTSLREEDRGLLGRGILIGHVIDEHKRPFGRGDFVVRGIVNVDRDAGRILVADKVRPGQTVQLHARDAVTAGEDLQLLLDGEMLKPRPFAALLYTCNGRGRRLFGEPHHDVGIIEDRIGPLPLSGFMAAGEIGPIGGRTFLHGHTAVLAVLRART